jgi:type IV pilus assembly protein PilA
MLARIRKAQEEKESGFTLIELLVVMIIIGILAAIAIPVFLSQRAKGQDSAAKADVSTVGKEIASYYVDGTTTPFVGVAGGQFRIGVNAAGATDVGRISNNVTLTHVPGGTVSATNWCVGVNNAEGSQKTWRYSAANGLEAGTCDGGLGGAAYVAPAA